SPCGKRADLIRIRGSPNGPLHTPSPQFTTPARDRSERVLGISRNDCSGSIGTGCSGSIGIAARDHSVRPVSPEIGGGGRIITAIDGLSGKASAITGAGLVAAFHR